MGLVSLIIALVLEQWRPLGDRRHLFAPVERYVGFFERQFNAGEVRHGRIAWLLAVLPVVAGTWIIYALLLRVSPLLGLVFNVAILYLTMGFRQFSHYFTGIRLALKQDDLQRAREFKETPAGVSASEDNLQRARELLAQWRGQVCPELSRDEVARLAIEEALAASHRHVFAVIFWFVLLPGPSGALLYRLAHYLSRAWGAQDTPEMSAFGSFSKQAYQWLDILPARLTAASFAVVGDFEDAVFCWRSQASRWSDTALGVVLAAGKPLRLRRYRARPAGTGSGRGGRCGFSRQYRGSRLEGTGTAVADALAAWNCRGGELGTASTAFATQRLIPWKSSRWLFLLRAAVPAGGELRLQRFTAARAVPAVLGARGALRHLPDE